MSYANDNFCRCGVTRTSSWGTLATKAVVRMPHLGPNGREAARAGRPKARPVVQEHGLGWADDLLDTPIGAGAAARSLEGGEGGDGVVE
jgi:hypothetical protein